MVCVCVPRMSSQWCIPASGLMNAAIRNKQHFIWGGWMGGWWGWMEILHNKYVIWSDLTVFRGIQMYICTPPDPQLTCLNFCQFMQSARSAEAENFHLNLNRQASVWYFSLSFSCVQPSATEGMPLSWTVHLYACLYNSSQLIPLCYRRLLWCCWCWDRTLSSLILT